MKPWYRSLTLWSLVATLAGLVLSGLGGGQSPIDLLGDPEVQATIGEILAALGLGGVLVGRARAAGPLTVRKDRGGTTTINLIVLLALLAVGTVAVLLGCGPHHVRAEQSMSVDVEVGPPCRVTVSADGHVVSTISGPVCRLDDLLGKTAPERTRLGPL